MSQEGMTWKDLALMWLALFDYGYENREMLEMRGLARPFTLCLQRLWQEITKLKEEEHG
jgi:hypothetical protein